MTADAGFTPRPGSLWQVQLPFTKSLSLNDRMHFRVKAKMVAKWRQETKEALVEAGVPPCGRVKATLIYIPATRRRRDPDNLVASFKPAVDALVDAGVVPDDTEEFVERVWPRILEPQPKLDGGRFFLRVEAL